VNVCVDASLVLKWLVPEEGSEEALSLYRVWRKNDIGLVAPGLIDYEVGTALRQKVVRGLLRSEDLYPVFDFYKRLDLMIFHLTDLVSQAVAAAAALEQPTIYDVSYLLIAKQQGIDFVTADERFFKAAHQLFSQVHYYKDLI
jgi:predicted nucleic acid-binding protein